MQDKVTLKDGTEVGVGTWLDGRYGWTNTFRIIDIAQSYGFEMDADDRAAVEWYKDSGNVGDSDDDLDKLEIVTGQGGLSEKATEHVQDLLPEGWILRWDAGELSLISAWSDCAADGGGCEVATDHDGNDVVEPCGDHRPERKIRISFRQGIVGEPGPVTYAVALWDEDGEILFRSDEVTLPASPGQVGGEYWFPETVPNAELRKTAERLVAASDKAANSEVGDAGTGHGAYEFRSGN